MTDNDSSKRTNRTAGRRSVLGAVGGTVAGLGVAIPGVGARRDESAHGGESDADERPIGEDDGEPTEPEEMETDRQGAESVSVIEALEVQETLLDSGRYCAVDDATLDAIDREVGDQLRVRRADAENEYAVYTVSERLENDEAGTVRMGADGRDRLGTDDTFDASANPTVPRPDLTEDGARASDEFVERLEDGGDRVAVLTPHGGDISPETDAQGDTVAERVSGTVHWGCKGWFAERGAFERWFVSPQDISPASFPELDRIVDRQFEYSVSFRGLESDGIDVVGDEDGEFTEDVADAIESAVGDDVDVSTRDLAGGSDAPYDDDQLTTRMTAEGGNSVWLGQSRDARENHGEEIADAVADVLEDHQRG